MGSISLSFLDTRGDSVVSGPAPVEPFVPGSANLSPKFVNRINDETWELWEFDAISADGDTAVGTSFYRDARGLNEGGFHVDLNAIWPDGTKWGGELYFPISAIMAEGSESSQHGGVRGIWQLAEAEATATFSIMADLSSATVRFSVPNRVTGTIELHALGGNRQSRLPKTEDDALLAPLVYYLFPMGPAAATVNLTFLLTDEVSGAVGEKKLGVYADEGARGSFVRGWSILAWPRFLTDAYYVCGTAGPYHVQLIRIASTAADNRKQYVVGRLYRDGELVCAANHTNSELTEDAAAVEKLLDGDEWLTGDFGDRNTGYAVEFISGGRSQRRKRWRFETRHKRAWWNDFTSDQGTGKSGFIEVFHGGSDDEMHYDGVGGGGQLQLPG